MRPRKSRTTRSGKTGRSGGKKRVEAWSYSRIYTYETCPAKLSYAVHDRIKEPPNDAMRRGSEVHDKAERYIAKRIRNIPKELTSLSTRYKELRNNPSVKVEDQWCFADDWREVDWYASDAHLRIKVDAHYRMSDKTEGRNSRQRLAGVLDDYEDLLSEGTCHRIVDHKTGMPREAQGQTQMSLYALGALKRYPDVDVVLAELWYVDHGQVHESVYGREDLPDLEKFWRDKTRAMLRDTTFRPTPNRFCGTCFYNAANGGPCLAPQRAQT